MDDSFKHKTLAIVELDGVEKTLYPLKQLMSEYRLSISSTGSDPKTGKHKADKYVKEGPLNVIMTYPKEGTDEEIENRTIITTMDESEMQTKDVHDFQRLEDSPEGIELERERESIIEVYQNLQRLLKIGNVTNTHAKYLKFNTSTHLTRRYNRHYLALIKSITLLYQYQREKIKVPLASGKYELRLKTHLIDIAIGNFIARRIFGRSLDELQPQTRKFLNQVEKMVKEIAAEKHIDTNDVSFAKEQIRVMLTGFYTQAMKAIRTDIL
jgi:ribosomal protein L15